MASQNSTERTAQLESAYKRDVVANMRRLQANLKIAHFAPITIGLAVASNDDIILGKVGCSGVLIPELSKVVGVTGSVLAGFTIEKVSADGTVTAISGAGTCATDGTPVGFARTSADVLQSFDADDYLQVTITEAAATDLAATDVIEIYLAFYSTDSVG